MVQELVKTLSAIASEWLIPIMILGFFFSVSLRALIWWTVRREYWFSVEFDKRVQRFINSTEDTNGISFFKVSKRLLEITFYELFEIRSIMKRRNPDVIMSWADRVFLVQQGCARIVNDVLRKIRFFKFENKTPNFSELSKSIYQNNPCFNKVFGYVPISGFNDFLNILPNLFVVCGILGTFLGIMDALPALENMDLSDVAKSKKTMDEFLLRISFSMSTSIVGIVLSVSMTFLNTFLSAEKLFLSTVDSLSESLQLLWDLSSNNEIPNSKVELDENRDPIEVLAEDVVSRELKVQPGFVKLAKPVQGWWLKDTIPETGEGAEKSKKEALQKEVIDQYEKIADQNAEIDPKDSDRRTMSQSIETIQAQGLKATNTQTVEAKGPQTDKVTSTEQGTQALDAEKAKEVAPKTNENQEVVASVEQSEHKEEKSQQENTEAVDKKDSDAA